MKIKSGNGKLNIGSLQKGLVGHWTMAQDSLKGSLLADKTPYENDGTIYGATFTTDRKGKANSAMSFDGVNDYIDCGNDDSLNITEAITISYWVKYISGGELGLAKNWNEWRFMKGYTLSIYNTIGGNYSNWNVSFIPVVGTWYHLTYSYDGSNQKFFLNGELKNTNSRTGSLLSSAKLYLGAYPSGNSFTGSIDDVRVYNRALSAEEIAFLYNSSR
jgi:hypothetical protein